MKRSEALEACRLLAFLDFLDKVSKTGDKSHLAGTLFLSAEVQGSPKIVLDDDQRQLVLDVLDNDTKAKLASLGVDLSQE